MECGVECSIVAAAYNGLPYTRLFVESVLACTDRPYELILVDDGSTDGTPAYLDGLARAHGHVTVLRNDANLGIAPSWNRGLAAAGGRFVALCNNDVVVSPGWLGRLVDELAARKHHGAVSAASNQVVLGHHPDLFPDDRAWLEARRPWPEPSWESLQAFYGDFYGYANDFAHRHRGVRTPSLYIPCLVMRREVLEDVGGFDEGLGRAFHEDLDFFARVLLNRRHNLVGIYGGVYVHHFVGATVIPLGVPRLMDESGPVYVRKWVAVTGERDWLGEYSRGRLDREGLLRLREEVRDRLPPPVPLRR